MLGSQPLRDGRRTRPRGRELRGTTVLVKRIGGALFATALIASSTLVLGPSPAQAAKAEPSISTIGWWWEDATTEEREVPGVGTVTIETPNPFCPSAGSGTGSPAQVCAEARLPIEVRNGDYEQQNKISAVGFDMSLIPIGSEVNKFTVTFREAKEGCYDKGEPDDDPSNDTCEETSPINVGQHQLQACLVTAYFGDSEARPYKEAPKYECSNADPKAKRKEVDSEKDGPGSNFYWTFDLTEYAQRWTAKFSAVTGIMLVGVPITTGQGDNAQQDGDSWRVVLAGPKFQNGVTTAIDYIPAEDPLLPPTDPTTTDPGTGIPTDTGTTGFDTGVGTTDTGDLGTGDPVDTGDTPGEETPAPAATELPAVAQAPEVEELPGYMWLALLAGLVGFSLVRSVVIEKTTGIRPDGVLATIHRLNTERTGASPVAAAPGAGPLAAVGGALGTVGKRLGGAFGKLNFRKKG